MQSEKTAHTAIESFHFHFPNCAKLEEGRREYTKQKDCTAHTAM